MSRTNRKTLGVALVCGLTLTGTLQAQTAPSSGIRDATNPHAASSIEPGKLAALKEALCFSGTKSGIIDALTRLAQEPLSSASGSRLKSAVGTNNLSVFYLCPGPGIWKQLQDCDWHDEGGAPYANVKLQKRLKGGESYFLPGDVRDLSWHDLGADIAEGTFRIETEWMFKGRCIFRATKQNGKWTISALAVAKTGSSKFEDGVTVFDVAANKPKVPTTAPTIRR